MSFGEQPSRRTRSVLLLSWFSYSFLAPPAVFIFLLVAGGLLALLSRRLGLVIAALAGLCLYALSTPVVGFSLLMMLEKQVPPATVPADAGAIVVLGGDLKHGDGGAVPDRVGLLSLERVEHAAELYRAHPLPILVCGGSIGDSREPIGRLMQRALVQDFAVPVRWVEETSRNTFENAQDTAALLLPQGIRTVLIVTQPWHMPRALWSFRRAGLTPVPAPTARLYIGGGVDVEDFLPDQMALMDSFFALHEIVGLLYYRYHYD